jgi:parvulin-like peptidyl-prolyl isomerase
MVKSSNQNTWSRRTIILAGCVVIFIGVVTAVLIYSNNRAPFRTTVLEVNDSSIRMGYFLKRVFIAQSNSMIVLQTLTNEEIIKQTAPRPPYNIRISEADIDRRLKTLAQDQIGSTDEKAYKAWFQQQLEQTRFTPDELRELVRTNLLTQRLILYLEERVPTVAEQVHLFMIPQRSLAEVQAANRRLDAGEDFLTLAQELAIDAELSAWSGDLGWIPRSGLAENLSRAAFDELDVGQISTPIVLDEQLTVIIMVAERATARRIEAEIVEKLKSRALNQWLLREIQHHRITTHGLNNGFDRETESWIQWQLQKMRKE